MIILATIFSLYAINPDASGTLLGIFGSQQECADEIAAQPAKPPATLQCIQDSMKMMDPVYREQHKVIRPKALTPNQ